MLAAFAFSGNRSLRILDSLHAPSFKMGLNSSVKEQFVDFCRKSSDNATKDVGEVGHDVDVMSAT